MHRCWWILQWPRQYVDAGFLSPLLLSAQLHRRTVSLVLEPLTPTRANRRVSLRQSGVRRSRRCGTGSGAAPPAGTRSKPATSTAAKSELVAGHGLYRMIGYLSVSADTIGELEAASGEIESLAQRSQLEVARLSGEHDQAFAAAALPLGPRTLR